MDGSHLPDDDGTGPTNAQYQIDNFAQKFQDTYARGYGVNIQYGIQIYSCLEYLIRFDQIFQEANHSLVLWIKFVKWWVFFLFTQIHKDRKKLNHLENI